MRSKIIIKHKGNSSKDECLFFGEKLMEFDIRFSAGGRILTRDPFKEHYNLMPRNYLRILLKEWYLKSHFSRRGKELDRFIDFFIDACEKSCKMLTSDGVRGESVEIEEKNI